jgi:hypothetical protein
MSESDSQASLVPSATIYQHLEPLENKAAYANTRAKREDRNMQGYLITRGNDRNYALIKSSPTGTIRRGALLASSYNRR